MSACSTFGGRPKVKHPSREKAVMHMLAIRKSKSLPEVQTYRCPKCSFWHVGRIPEKMILRAARKRYIRREEAIVGMLIGALKQVINRSSL